MVNIRTYCPECKKDVDADLDEHGGCVVCTECATAIEDQYIDDTQDVRIFDDNQDAQRVEAVRPSQTMGNDPFATAIAGGKHDRIQKRVQQHLDNIERVASAVGESCTPAIRTQAHHLLGHLLSTDTNAMRGKHGVHVTAIYAASLYIASRQVDKPMTVAELSRVDPQLGGHYINHAVKFIQEKIARAAKTQTALPRMKPQKIKGATDEQEAAHLKVLADVAATVGDPPCTLPVVNQGRFLFHELFRSGISPLAASGGISLTAIYAACLYVAARQVAHVIFADEFTAKIDGLRQRDVIAAWIFLREHIPAASAIYFPGVGNIQPQRIVAAAAPQSSRSDVDQHIRAPISRICKALKFSFKERRIAEEIGDAVFKNVALKKKPASIAAAICWVLCQLFGKNCSECLKIIEQNSVSRITMRGTMKLLMKHLPQYVPANAGFGEAEDWMKRLKLPPWMKDW